MGEIIIKTPIKEKDIKKIAQILYQGLKNKESCINLSKALCIVRNNKFPRTKTQKYGSLTRGLTFPELEEFFSLFKPEEYRFRFYCLWSLWWGNRQGETYKLNLSDFKLENQSIFIYREKNEGPQEFKIDNSIWTILQEYFLHYQKEITESNGHIFFTKNRAQTNKPRKHWSSNWIRKKFREILGRNEKFNKSYANADCWNKKAKPRKLYQYTTHSLRYSFAYLAIDLFGDPTKVKELMGHKKLDSTMHYLENYRKSQTKEFSLIMQKQSQLKQLIEIKNQFS